MRAIECFCLLSKKKNNFIQISRVIPTQAKSFSSVKRAVLIFSLRDIGQ